MVIIHRKVLFGDCDPAGVVYTPRVGHFVLEAVIEFLDRQMGQSALRRIEALGVIPPARQLNIEFTHPMRPDDELEISVWVQEVRQRSYTFRVEGRVKHETAFKGQLTQVCVDPHSFEPVAIPPELKAVLQANTL